MYALKEKVTEKLSHLLSDSPTSSLPLSISLDRNPQTKSYSRGGKSLSTYFSFIIPSTVFDRSNSTKHNHDFEPAQSSPVRHENVNDDSTKEPSGSFVECIPVCECSSESWEKEIPNNQGDCGDQAGSGSEVLEEAKQHSPQKSLPDLTDDSVFISADIYEFLQSCLPNIVKGCQWVLLYSTLKHGISLRTLIRKSNNLSGPCLPVAGDMQGAVFGGLLECPLKPTAKRKYQGTNQTFVFTTIYGEPRLFRPTGANRYYYLCLNDLLALGGGSNFALSLEGDLLYGTSGPCDTFGNLCLAHKPEFEMKNVEETSIKILQTTPTVNLSDGTYLCWFT